MSRNTRTVLVVLFLVVLSLCTCTCAALVLPPTGLVAWAVSGAVPGRAARVAADIADFDVPSDYRLSYGVRILGFRGVSIESMYHDGGIALVCLPRWLQLSIYQPGDWVQDTNIATGLRSAQVIDWRPVGQKETVVAGQTITLYRREGRGEEDRRLYRSEVGLFEGRSGPTVISVILPLAEWDEAEIDAFLASIRK